MDRDILLLAIVSENSQTVKQLREQLEEVEGISVSIEEFHTLDSSRAAIEKGDIDLVLIDEDLASASDFSILKHREEWPYSPQFLVIINRDNAETRLKFLESGALGTIVRKHVGTSILRRMIQHACIFALRCRLAYEHMKMRRLILEDKVEGAAFVDVDENFVDCNPSAEDIFGVPPGSLVGRNLSEFIDGELLKMVESKIDSRRRGERGTYELEITRLDGEKRDLLVTVTPRFDQSGNYTGAYGIFIDRTEHKEMAEELERTARQLSERDNQLEQAREEQERARKVVEEAARELQRAYQEAAKAGIEAESASEAKDRFFANIGHEIRTPMTSIIGFAKLLKSKVTDHESLVYIDHILTSGMHLLTLLNDVLDISRIAVGKFEINPKPVFPEYLVADVMEQSRPDAEQKGLKLRVGTKDLPQRVMMDEDRVRQVLTNLLVNAIKFTEEGEVELSVGIGRDGKGLIFTVRDTGPGIPEEEREKIFEPFYRMRETGRSPSEGAGLGLAITSRLVYAMGGGIELESEPGEGTRFTVILPCEFLELESDERAGIAETMIVPEPLEGLKVLIADDHPPNRALIRHILEEVGHTVVLARDGEEAVEAFRREAFDLLVLDMQMPVMDGYQAIRRIRSLPGGDRVPIISITAYAMKEDREKCLAAGADDYIAKPFDPDDLLSLVEKHTKDGAKYASQPAPDPELDELRRQYLQDLIEKAEIHLEKEPSPEEIKVWGHRIAGSAGSFGYNELSVLGRLLEQGDPASDRQWVTSMINRLIRKALDALNALTDAGEHDPVRNDS